MESWHALPSGRAATCEAVAHPLGLEMVVMLAGEIMRTEVARTPAAAQQAANRGRAMFEANGWAA